MIWWMSFDDSFEDEVKVTIIATWFNEQASSKRRVIKTDTLWRPIRNEGSDFVTRVVNNWWFTSSQTWGFSNTSVEDEAPDLTSNNAFRAPDNSDEDWETPAFMTKKLNNWEEKVSN
jgi:hypothetical protein